MKRAAILTAIVIVLTAGVLLAVPQFTSRLAGRPARQSTPKHIRLPVAMIRWTGLHPTPTPTPTPTSPGAIVLSDGPGGLSFISVPATVPLTVGHVAYLPIEVRSYHRPIEVRFQSLMHTYVNDAARLSPTDAATISAGMVVSATGELMLQTLRMRPHPLTLVFVAGNDRVAATLTLSPSIQPRTPLFSIHPDTPAYVGIPVPFLAIWGPACASCPTTPGDPPGTTRDVACAKQLDSCNCHPVQRVLVPEQAERALRQGMLAQRYAVQFVRGAGGWGGIQHAPGQYIWDDLDWLFGLPPDVRDYSPLFTGVLDGNFGWMTCPQYTNPDGSRGFYDVRNGFVLRQFRDNMYQQVARYAPDLRFVEMGNEPAAEFYLCPCTTPPDMSDCNATCGPNQPPCVAGPNSPEFVAAYGDLLFTASDAAAREMAAANPYALLITGALEITASRDHDLTATTEYMISRGLLDNDNVAIGFHQFPYFYPNWLPDPPDSCAYFQDPANPYSLPDGCETAPPLDDYTTPLGRLIPARQAWQTLDERIDSSGFLSDALALGVLDRFYLFDTELHAGFHDADPTTTPAREALAGLRIGAINAHQRVIGTEFIFAPADPAAYNLLVKHLSGATPVYRWDAPLMGADYSGLVYKLFTRGNEDIIAFWSNAEDALALNLDIGAAQLRRVALTRFADADGSLSITSQDFAVPPAAITVIPIREFYFLSVISDKPGFGWLENLNATVPAANSVSHPKTP